MTSAPAKPPNSDANTSMPSGPAFSPDGKYLYFLGDREWAPLMSSVEQDYATNRSTEILAYALRKDVANPFAPRNDSAAGESSPPQHERQGQ